jgi:hypothetical protein
VAIRLALEKKEKKKEKKERLKKATRENQSRSGAQTVGRFLTEKKYIYCSPDLR